MTTSQEQRHIFYDCCLGIEAYQLSGIVQKFPNHFHECYVIGFIEGGCRHLWCRGSEYDLSRGDLILFNPKDNHFCSPMNGELLDYRALNIPVPVMKKAAADITGKEFVPQFTVNVVYHSDITTSLADVYNAIVTDASPFEKEEAFFFLLEQILKEHSAPYEEHNGVFLDSAIADTCEYLKEHYSENITLEELTEQIHLSKSWLLHTFTKQTGVSPYRYLQSIRLEEAKKLLEQAVPPIDAAARAGFTDQSHFTRFFKDFTGLTPKQYQKIFTESGRDTTAGTEE